MVGPFGVQHNMISIEIFKCKKSRTAFLTLFSRSLPKNPRFFQCEFTAGIFEWDVLISLQEAPRQNLNSLCHAAGIIGSLLGEAAVLRQLRIPLILILFQVQFPLKPKRDQEALQLTFEIVCSIVLTNGLDEQIH